MNVIVTLILVAFATVANAVEPSHVELVKAFDADAAGVEVVRVPRLTADLICAHSTRFKCDHEEDFITAYKGMLIRAYNQDGTTESTILVATEDPELSQEFIYAHELVHHLIKEGEIEFEGTKIEEEEFCNEVAEEVTGESYEVNHDHYR